MIHTSCEICGDTRFEEIPIARLYTGDQPLHCCRGCGFVQVLARRSPEEIWAEWDGQSAGDSVYLSAIPPVAARHAYVASFIDEHIDPGIVCDVGAADGKFSWMLRCLSSPKAIHNYTGMAEELEGRYDTITLLWTLENCGSCKAVIDACRRALRPGGHLVVATGSRLLVPYKKPLWQYLGKAPLDLHPWRFSRQTLFRLLMVCGFDIFAVNEHIGSDYLVMIATPSETKAVPEWKDSASRVIDYFERWHRFTQGYHPA